MAEPKDSTAPGKAARLLPFVALHLILLLYSAVTILSKNAALAGFPSPTFVFCYGGALLLLVVYAVVWQWLLRSLPLSVAYANKGITLVWGMVWGYLIFSEPISIGMIIGALLVFAGIWLVVTDNG